MAAAESVIPCPACANAMVQTLYNNYCPSCQYVIPGEGLRIATITNKYGVEDRLKAMLELINGIRSFDALGQSSWMCVEPMIGHIPFSEAQRMAEEISGIIDEALRLRWIEINEPEKYEQIKQQEMAAQSLKKMEEISQCQTPNM